MLFFSQELSAEHPATSIATVIPAMDTIDEVLATNALSSKYSVAIHAALSVDKKTLNYYYEKTDFSKTYHIAMGISSFTLHFIIAYCPLFSVLHPHHKLNYFKSAKWKDDQIKAVAQLVQDKFDLSYNLCDMSQSLMLSHKVHTTYSYHFCSPYLILHHMNNRLWYAHQKAITYLTTWLLLLHLRLWIFVMSLIATSALTLNTLLMLFTGGMIVMQNILACRGWQSIILLSLISDYIHIFILKALYNITSYLCWC
jgi:hypothetical protein